MVKKIKVAELFAGVGGFRLGLEGWQGKSSSSDYKTPIKTNFEVIWSNQWEPSTKSQDASIVYEYRFGHEGHSNIDIASVNTERIPDHDMLVGGFPCQDYSVAKTLSRSDGLTGKKGVLWWEIYRILKEKALAKKPVSYVLLENVDRLLKSPVTQRGRDFAIILASLSDLGYATEWRVINAADYGFPQRRRRTFILAYYKDTELYSDILKNNDPSSWLNNISTFAQAFPVSENLSKVSSFRLFGDLAELSENFNTHNRSFSPFENSGIIIDRQIFTHKVVSYHDGPKTTLADILEDEQLVDKSFFIDLESLPNWKRLKGAKNEIRINKMLGFEYRYNEGAMLFPDSLEQPSRTIITGEGGPSPSRFKHVIQTQSGKLRRLTPIELERLNMFPINHTKGPSDTKRAFFMGNALVVGVIEKIGQQLMSLIEQHDRVTV